MVIRNRSRNRYFAKQPNSNSKRSPDSSKVLNKALTSRNS